MSPFRFNDEVIVDARSCIINLAEGRRWFEKTMLRHYDLVKRGEPTPDLDGATRMLLEHIHSLYPQKGDYRHV